MAGDVINTVYGLISAEFAKSPLRDLCVPDCGVQTGPFGSQLHASDYVGYGTPIITVEHLGENRIIHNNLPRVTEEDKTRLSRYTLITGDIVFSRVGSVDRRAIVHPEENGWLFSGRCLRVRPDRNKIAPGFLSWFFGLPAFQEHIRQIAVGATMPSLNTKILGDVPIYYPPSLKKQQAIACILDTLDDKTELNRRMNQTLEEMARAIFKSWFVDFDPVRAKAEGQVPSGLAPHMADLFPDSFEESELGEMPKGWELSRIGNEVATVLGGTPSRAEPAYWGGDIPWINSGKANEFRVIEPSEFITQEGLNSSATKMLALRTTVIAITGATLGQVSLTEIETCANQSIVGVIGTPALPSEFIYLWVKENIDRVIAWQTGGAQQHINKNNVNDLPVLCPDASVVTAYLRLVGPMFDRIKECCFETRTLAALRDSLLPKLVSGELRVPDADRIVGRGL